jgi:putative tryptophan/tyrosine transport system substrate-binding protein
MTGFANWGAVSQGGRWLELFKEAVPRLTRVADISPPGGFFINAGPLLRASIAAAAAQYGVTIIRMPVQSEMEHAISAFAAEPDGGVLLTGAFQTNIAPEAIGRLALYHHWPLMYGGNYEPRSRRGRADGAWP